MHSRRVLSEALRIDVVELPRLEAAHEEGEPEQLQRWARFLRFDDRTTLEFLAKEDPIMAEAKSALELLSREPSARRIAEMRRDAEIERRLDRAEDLDEGREQGLEQGRAEGLTEGLRKAIVAVCGVLDIELDSARTTAIATADEVTLSAWLDHLRRTRRWPGTD